MLRPRGADSTDRGDVQPYTLRRATAGRRAALRRLRHCPRRPPAGFADGAGLRVETYAHVIDALDGKRYTDLDALIAAARTELVFRRSSVTAEHHG